MKDPEQLGEVFISYSHDSEEHVKTVLDFANRLRLEGIDCVLDQYEVAPPEGWPRWMDRKINDAAFVLMICTAEYQARVMGTGKPDAGLGVKWEGNLIYQHIYNSGSRNTKFIPVLLKANDHANIPTPLQGTTRYCVSTGPGYDDLYYRLIGQPKAEKPPLGKRRPLEKKSVKTDFSLYVAMPIDVELWDRARWRATAFLAGGGQPPVLGLAFLDGKAGQEIFEGWHHRYDSSDQYEELRISIVEGSVAGEDPGYTVHIGPDPQNTIRRYREAGLDFDVSNDGIVAVSRMNRMNPSADSIYLQEFKKAFQIYKTYTLAPCSIAEDGSGLKFYHHLGIHKSSIHFRNVSDIHDSKDIDSSVLRTGRTKRASYKTSGSLTYDGPDLWTRELKAIQFAIISENVANNFLLHLGALKNFFIAHQDRMASAEVNSRFFNEWLTHPFIGQRVLDPSFTAEKIGKLKNAVVKLVL